MSSSSYSGRDAPNPLRPYYISPSIGQPPDSNSYQTFSSGNRNALPAPPKQPFSSARDMLSDLDYSDYLSDSSPSVMDMMQELLDQALWKYTSVLLAQPFEVAKMVLQCQIAAPRSGAIAGSIGVRGQRPTYTDDRLYPDSDGSDFDEPSSYFTPSVPISCPSRSPTTRSGHRRRTPSQTISATSPTTSPSRSHKLALHRQDSLLEVLSQLWQKESAWGVWKGTNTSFIYSVLYKTIECWTRSLLAALLSIPDPGLLPSSALGIGSLDIADSPSPWASLGIAVAAAGIAGVLLSPLDTIRTRTPLFIRQKLHLDPIQTPTPYSLLTFLSHVGELFVRLPLETVLRRGQMDYVMRNDPTVVTVVDVGPYDGVFGTMWWIVKEERLGVGGEEKFSINARKRRKGQGVEGLWRGWRVGMWGLLGVWGAAALGGAHGAGQCGEF
ncbi:hypothetical protein GP486_003178 [Trichoglossum hirsutum]|uniref:Mitochondrial carrier n=1 Tax=Trichoglossum hirsutum TaxID=265104 RepID=A0A9P8LDK1_9PEZI|nr:hypothetical protein GP486_003178 [Trichoglossum hirsutum]